MGERFYRFSRWCVRRLFNCLGGLETRGGALVPPEGPLIVASNHASFLDPMLLGAALNRSLHFMARRTLFDAPVFGWAIRQAQAFPLDRGGDSREAIRAFGSLLEIGSAVVMFPEGTRTSDGATGEMRSGVGMLAVRNRSPVLPAYIWGSFQSWPRGRSLPRRHRFKVLLGRPVFPDAGGERKSEQLRVTGEVGRAIFDLERTAWLEETEPPPPALRERWDGAVEKGG